ncbi:MAG TPA: hypothetical protein QGI59_01130 [Candidatus Poseidoniia archaeon]|nr:hypothetical protein [Candidatus Poseidoniia archaeon]
MQRIFVIIVILVFTMPGCLDSLKDSVVSCDNITGECRYEILRGNEYSKIHIEVNYVTGNSPESDALNLLKQRIQEVTDKSTITVSQSSFGSTDNSYTLEEILELENKQRTRFKNGNTFVVHILYLNGEYSDNDQTLGLAYSGTSFAIFKEKIEDAAFLLISSKDIEKSVIVHEFGHLLGLVNNGYQSPHDHEDSQHPHHSNNEESVMYWAIESQDIGNQIDGEPPNDFDNYDLDDLKLMKEGKL